MKKMKKVISLLLSVSMVLTMVLCGSVTAFAMSSNETFTLTINYANGSVTDTWTYDSTNVAFVDSDGYEYPFMMHGDVYYSLQDGLATTSRMGVISDYVDIAEMIGYYELDVDSITNLQFGNSSTNYLPFLLDSSNRFYYPSYAFNQTLDTTSYGWQTEQPVPFAIALSYCSSRMSNMSGSLGLETDPDPLEVVRYTLKDSIGYNGATLMIGQTQQDAINKYRFSGNMYGMSNGTYSATITVDGDGPSVPCTHTNTTESTTANNDGTHTTTVTCADCSEVVSTTNGDCSYTYVGTGSGTHIGTCTVCDGTTEPQACTYENGFCTVCGDEEPQAPVTYDYTLTAAAMASSGTASSAGTVSLSSTEADEGDNVAVTAIPSAGYYLAQVRYTTDGAVYTNAALTGPEGSRNGAAFEMPAGNVSVIADFVSVVWDGALDFNWYDENNLQSSYNMYYPAQWEALAWICSEDISFLTDTSADASAVAAAGYDYAYQYNTAGNIAALYGKLPVRTDLSSGSCMGQNYFTGVDFNIMNDMDFGGTGTDYYKNTTLTSLTSESDYYTHMGGKNYYPVGSQAKNDGVYQNSDSSYHFYATFCGSVYGNGHLMDNIRCDRGDASNIGGAYGGSNYYQSTALIGRIGRSDGAQTDYDQWANADCVVKDIAVDGFIYGERSVGGIVGKTLHVGSGKTITVENCINFATIWSTQSKGSGGIIGASWNRPIVENCVNFGRCINGYRNGCGGVTGSAEGTFTGCYNAGMVSINSGNPASFGSQNAGATAENCYFLLGSTFSGGGAYSNSDTPFGVYGSWNPTPIQVNSLSDMQSASFLSSLNNGGRSFVRVGTAPAALDSTYTLKSSTLGAALTSHLLMYNYTGESASTQTGAAMLPIPRAFVVETSTITGIVKTSDPAALSYVEGQSFDTSGLVISANWSDGTSEAITDYTVSKTTALETSDSEIVISGTYAGSAYSFSLPITVTANALSSISVNSQPTNKLYASDETVSTEGMSIRALYTNGTSEVLNDADWTYAISGSTLTASYTYRGVTETAEVALTILDTPAPSAVSGVYQISCANDMLWFANRVNIGVESSANAELTADIDMTGLVYTPIGISSSKSYSGEFDGNSHKVTFNISSASSNVALVGYCTNANIHDVDVYGTITVTGTGSRYIAGIVGQSSGATIIENCSNYANISGGYYVSGIVAYASGIDAVRNCFNYGSITSTNTSNGYAGGIGGYISGAAGSTAVVENCGNEGIITAAGANVGGVIGYIKSVSNGIYAVSGCYNTGNVTAAAKNYVGGVIGYAYSRYASDTITNLYNTGSVNGGSYVGGVVGYAYGYSATNTLTVTNIYNMGTVTSSSSNTTYTGAVAGSTYTGTTVSNAYYLTNTHANVQGTGARGTVTASAKTIDEFYEDGFAASLSSSFKDASCGAPLLAYQTDDSSHQYEYVDNGNGTHTGTCSVCAAAVTGDCTFVEGICTECGASQGYEVTLNNSDSDGIMVTGIGAGLYQGSVTFTVASDNTCMVFVGTGENMQPVAAVPTVQPGVYSYTISVDAADTVSVYYKGDANCDGTISAADVGSIILQCKGTGSISTIGQTLANIDGRSGLSVTDADKLMKAFYGVENIGW